MSSLRRIAASRANGARSRGPVTPPGKARSAANALRHGLLAQNAILRLEPAEGFQAHLDDFVERLQPSDTVELSLVEELAVSVWRQRRCWAIETQLVDDAAAARPAHESPRQAMAGAYSALAQGPELSLIHRYEARIHRMYQRALSNLLLLREAPVPNEPSPISEHDQDTPLGPV
jgi:hypothetical protein